MVRADALNEDRPEKTPYAHYEFNIIVVAAFFTFYYFPPPSLFARH